MTRCGQYGGMNAHFDALYNVRALSLEVDRHLGGLALHCGDVADDDEVHCGYTPIISTMSIMTMSLIISFLHVLKVPLQLSNTGSLIPHD